MNEKTKAFIEAVSKTIASEKLFREVITPAQNTFTPSKDIELDRETVQKAIGEALSLLPDAHTAIIWVTNGVECALVDTVAFPNSGDESTCFVAGYATRPDVLAEFFVRRLADYGAFENVDEDTEADVFSYLYDDEGEGEKPTFFREVEEKGKITLKAIVPSSSAPEVITAKEKIVKAVEAAAADTANADNCIADYHFSVESADEDGKDIKKLSIVFEN